MRCTPAGRRDNRERRPVHFPVADGQVHSHLAAPLAAVEDEIEVRAGDDIAVVHEAPMLSAVRSRHADEPAQGAQKQEESPGRQLALPVEQLLLWPGSSSSFSSFRFVVPILLTLVLGLPRLEFRLCRSKPLQSHAFQARAAN